MLARILAGLTLCLVVQVGLTNTSQAVQPDAFQVTRVPVPSPFVVAVDQRNHTAYVISPDAIDVIDETTNVQTATIPFSEPYLLAVDDVTRTLAVLSVPSDPILTTIDATTGAVLATKNLSNAAYAVAVDPRIHRVFVGSSAGLLVLKEQTLAVTDLVPLSHVNGLVVNSRTKTVWVTCGGAPRTDPGTLNAVDEKTDTVSASVTVGVGPLGVAVDEDTNTLYVANDGASGTSHRAASTVSVVDGATATVTDAIPTNHGVEQVAVDPSRKLVYATEDLTQGRVLIINGHSKSIVAKLTMRSPFDVAVDPLMHTAYVPLYFNNSVAVISRS